VIYGLGAALGWGFADFGGAVAGRRIGSRGVAIVAQGLSAVAVTLAFFLGGHHANEIAPVVWWMVLNGAVSAAAYATHYRALQLGPISVVSPVSAAYAVVGVGLSMIVLDERPGPVALGGAAVTVVGVMLASTDVKKLRAGTHGVPPGLPWALAAAVLFGVGGFVLGWASKQVGWMPALWASRTMQFVGFAAAAAVRPGELGRIGRNRGTWVAAATGAADLFGVSMFSFGAHAGFVSIVLVTSAVFPLIAVALSITYLHERPVLNQLVGAVVVVAGLVMLGLG
jgi:drug/metabolite transporter (DMT)-like permease